MHLQVEARTQALPDPKWKVQTARIESSDSTSYLKRTNTGYFGTPKGIPTWCFLGLIPRIS